MVLTKQQLRDAISVNPFPDAEKEPKTLHLFFLEKPAKPNALDALDSMRNKTEQFELTDEVFYLHAPDGISRSKLASKAERLLGVTATAETGALF